jgi:hypothetical protein
MLKYGFPSTAFPEDVDKIKDTTNASLTRYSRLLSAFLDQLVQQRRAILASTNARDAFLTFCAPYREQDERLQTTTLSPLACPYFVLKPGLLE